jgi:hypothetical protein
VESETPTHRHIIEIGPTDWSILVGDPGHTLTGQCIDVGNGASMFMHGLPESQEYDQEGRFWCWVDDEKIFWIGAVVPDGYPAFNLQDTFAGI